MPTQFYRKQNDKNLYEVGSNRKISATEFGIGTPNAGKGFQEVKNINPQTLELVNPTKEQINDYNSKFNIIKQPTNVGTPDILNRGLNSSGLINQLPSQTDTNLALNTFATRASETAAQTLKDSQAELANFQAQQLKNNDAALQAENANLAKIQADKQNNIDTGLAEIKPFNDSLVSTVTKQGNALNASYSQQDYEKLFNDKKSLTNDIQSYSKMLSDELNTPQSNFASVNAAKKSKIISDYTSKVAIAQSALQAIDGNFELANTILQNGSARINNMYTNQLQTINIAEQLFGGKETDSKNKIASLTSDQNKLITEAKTTIESNIKKLEENQKFIQELMKNQDLAPVIAKAGITLDMTPKQVSEKLNEFYKNNRNYGDKYSFTTITDENGNEKVVALNNTTGQTVNFSSGNTTNGNGIVDGYNIATYATDPNHEEKVANIYNSLKFNTVSDIDAYIKSNFPNSPITGQMIANTSEKYEVSWEMLVAMMQQDSSLGTAGKGARTFNPGNVGNDDSGNIRNYNNWQAGVDAVGNWLNSHRATGIESTSKSAENYAKLIQEGKLQLTNVPEKQRAAVVNVMANSGAISMKDEQVTNILQEKINLVTDIYKNVSTGGSGTVGPNSLARITFITNPFTGVENEFIGKVHQLISKETLDTLLNLKIAGGTLGALSDQERIMLQNAATQLSSWEEKDSNGVGKGVWKVSQKAFKEELNKIYITAKKALDRASGGTGIINSLEQFLANNPNRVDEYNVIVNSNPGLSNDDYLQLMGVK